MYETNKYTVTPVNKYAQKVGPTEKAKSYGEIAAAKKRSREKLHKKRQKFDVYNESKKKFVSA